MFYVWSIVSVGLGAVYLNYLITNECHVLLGLIGVGFILGKCSTSPPYLQFPAPISSVAQRTYL